MQQSDLNPTEKNLKNYNYKWSSNSIILALVIWLANFLFYMKHYTLNAVFNVVLFTAIFSILAFYCRKERKWVRWGLLLFILYVLIPVPVLIKNIHLSNFYIGYLLHILFLILAFTLMFVRIR